MDTDSSVDAAALHHALIDNLVDKQLITSPAVEAAFRAVRREFFLPDLPPEQVYDDRAISTKVNENGRPISSSSQPAMMAIMLEQLDLQPGHNVLEIGAGTGYNAALMAHIVGPNGRVTTIDLEADLVESARAHLAAAGFEQVQVICGDGMLGYAANAPYDRIILTVAGWDITPEWLAQLRPDGRLLMPLSFHGPQLSVAFDRQNGRLISHSIKGCGFMPMRGPLSEPIRKIQIGDQPGLTLMLAPGAPPHQTEPAVLEAWLHGSFTEQPTGIEVSGSEMISRWPFWAALYEPNQVILEAFGDVVAKNLVPYLLGADDPKPWRMSLGLLTDKGLALLSAPPDTGLPASDAPFAQTISLHIRSYGPDKTVGKRLRRRLQVWKDAGRPWIEGLELIVVPREATVVLPEADVQVARRWHSFCIRWEST